MFISHMNTSKSQYLVRDRKCRDASPKTVFSYDDDTTQ